MSSLQTLSTNAFVQRQLKELDKRTKRTHRLLAPGERLTCLDAIFVCMLRDLIPDSSRDYPAFARLADTIVVQEFDVEEENENVELYAQFAYNIDTEGMRRAGIPVWNALKAHDFVPAEVEIHFELERRWFKNARPSVWASRFLNVARRMTRLARATPKIKFVDDLRRRGIRFHLGENTHDRENAVQRLTLYPKWEVFRW